MNYLLLLQLTCVNIFNHALMHY